MQLNALKSVVAAEFRKYDGVSKKEDAKNENIAKKSDKTLLSSEARNAGQASTDVKILSARIAAEPEIRTDKVEQVRERIQSGFYNSEEFAGQLADKLIKDFTF
jgi:anti-sigma28 factor (negative regulator of flagellin synthesis)